MISNNLTDSDRLREATNAEAKEGKGGTEEDRLLELTNKKPYRG